MSNDFEVLADGPIKKVEDLKGKVVATNAAGAGVDIAMRAKLGTPIAYFVENLREGDTGDINRINVYLAPKPSTSGSVTMDIIMDAPNITIDDLEDTTEVPVAQAYTESVFLPIARYLIMLSSQFSRPELRPQINSDYQTAMVTLGYQGGFPNAAQPGPAREVEG